ncbi:MAG: hypothetical protein ABSF65_10475 [Candidatus Bathyarchaeia archaeon]|jgi:uncharacterized membrane protein YuzA (DUF378 family)
MLVCVALVFGVTTMLQQTGAININDDIFYTVIGLVAGILIITAGYVRSTNGKRTVQT